MEAEDDSHHTFCMLIIDDCRSLSHPSACLVNTCIKQLALRTPPPRSRLLDVPALVSHKMFISVSVRTKAMLFLILRNQAASAYPEAMDIAIDAKRVK